MDQLALVQLFGDPRGNDPMDVAPPGIAPIAGVRRAREPTAEELAAYIENSRREREASEKLREDVRHLLEVEGPAIDALVARFYAEHPQVAGRGVRGPIFEDPGGGAFVSGNRTVAQENNKQRQQRYMRQKNIDRRHDEQSARITRRLQSDPTFFNEDRDIDLDTPFRELTAIEKRAVRKASAVRQNRRIRAGKEAIPLYPELTLREQAALEAMAAEDVRILDDLGVVPYGGAVPVIEENPFALAAGSGAAELARARQPQKRLASQNALDARAEADWENFLSWLDSDHALKKANTAQDDDDL